MKNIWAIVEEKLRYQRFRVLRNSRRKVLIIFSKNISIKDSNEAKVMAILETLPMFILTVIDLWTFMLFFKDNGEKWFSQCNSMGFLFSWGSLEVSLNSKQNHDAVFFGSSRFYAQGHRQYIRAAQWAIQIRFQPCIDARKVKPMNTIGKRPEILILMKLIQTDGTLSPFKKDLHLFCIWKQWRSLS